MRKIVGTILILILCFSFCFAFSVNVFAGKNTTYIKTSSDTAGDVTPITNIFFLPSGTSPEAVTVCGNGSAYSFTPNGEKHAFKSGDTIDVSAGLTGDDNGNAVYVIYVDGTKYSLYFADSIPTVYVATSKGLASIASSRDARDKNAHIYITDENGNAIYDDNTAGTESEIKCRGNASFGYAKKPFQIKLGKKTDLFGMGKAKTWILLANYIDCSYIRNDLAFKIADALEFDFTPESKYVNLYIDKQYYGLFEITEKVQIATNRIEIDELENENEKANEGTDLDSLSTATVSNDELCNTTNVSSYSYCVGVKNSDDITGGYLVELDNLYSYREKCKFTTDNGNSYVIKSPECASREQVQYIAELFAEFEEGMYNDDGYNSLGKHYTEYADLDSLVKVYTVQEITKNWDAYIGSTFFYKDKDSEDGTVSEIYAGPVWDFDNAWGNLHRGTFFSEIEEVWAQGYGNYGGSKYKSDFGFNLMMHEEAETLAETYFDIACRVCDEMTEDGGYIDTLAEKLTSSALMDRMRWNQTRHSDFAFYVDFNGEETDTAIGFLKNYIWVRSQAMREKFSFAVPDEPDDTTASTTVATTAVTAEATTEATTATTVATTVQTTATTAETTDATTEVTADGEKSGCGASVCSVSAIIIAVMTAGIAFVCKKRR